MMNDEWWMMNDEWWMMNDDEWWMMNAEWWMMNDDWWMKNDDWMVKDEDRKSVKTSVFLTKLCENRSIFSQTLSKPIKTLCFLVILTSKSSSFVDFKSMFSKIPELQKHINLKISKILRMFDFVIPRGFHYPELIRLIQKTSKTSKNREIRKIKNFP